MLHLKPKFKVKDDRLRIGELLRRTGTSTSRIRFYERHEVLPKPIRNENGYREYPDTAAKILELIDAAQRLGFSLSEIRTGLSEPRQISRHPPRWRKRCEASSTTSIST